MLGTGWTDLTVNSTLTCLIAAGAVRRWTPPRWHWARKSRVLLIIATGAVLRSATAPRDVLPEDFTR